jgi:hypothetical protein
MAWMVKISRRRIEAVKMKTGESVSKNNSKKGRRSEPAGIGRTMAAALGSGWRNDRRRAIENGRK